MQRLITIATDGHTDWVQTADGLRRNLGALSVARLVGLIAPDTRTVRAVLDKFLADGSVMMHADVERLEAILSRRTASVLIRPEDRRTRLTEATEEGTQMVVADILSKRIAVIERIVANLNVNTAPGRPVHREIVHDMYRRASSLLEAEESPGPESVERTATLAEEALSRISSARTEIDRLVSAGRQFNVVRARSDLHGLALRIGSVLKEVDRPGSAAEMVELHRRATHIHGLFLQEKPAQRAGTGE